MLAEGVNGLFGHSALIIGLAASVFGAGALATATLLKDQRLVRTVQGYVWVVLVGAGFVLLPLGVIAHRRLSRLLASEDASASDDDINGGSDHPSLSTSLSTSAAPGV